MCVCTSVCVWIWVREREGERKCLVISNVSVCIHPSLFFALLLFFLPPPINFPFPPLMHASLIPHNIQLPWFHPPSPPTPGREIYVDGEKSSNKYFCRDPQGNFFIPQSSERYLQRPRDSAKLSCLITCLHILMLLFRMILGEGRYVQGQARYCWAVKMPHFIYPIFLGFFSPLPFLLLLPFFFLFISLFFIINSFLQNIVRHVLIDSNYL